MRANSADGAAQSPMEWPVGSALTLLAIGAGLLYLGRHSANVHGLAAWVAEAVVAVVGVLAGWLGAQHLLNVRTGRPASTFPKLGAPFLGLVASATAFSHFLDSRTSHAAILWFIGSFVGPMSCGWLAFACWWVLRRRVSMVREPA